MDLQERPHVPFVQFGDYVSGMYAAIGIMAALSRKPRSATFVDVPIVQSLVSLLILPASSSYFTTAEPPARGQSLAFGSEPYYSIYKTSDGRYLPVAAIECPFWKNLMRALGLSGLADLRDGTKRDRARLKREMKKVFASKTRDEWAEGSDGEKDTCVTPILDIHEALDSKWARDVNLVGKSSNRPVINQPLKVLDGRFDHRRRPFSGAAYENHPMRARIYRRGRAETVRSTRNSLLGHLY